VGEVAHHCVQAVDAEVEHEDEEDLEVALPNAIVHPAAMMIHAQDAAATLTAVVGARRLHALTLLADFHEFVLKVLNLMVGDCDLTLT